MGLIFDILNELSKEEKPKDKKKDNDLMPWEEDAKENEDYEDYNFEEEDLEEDDYYFEDDK